jgi:hypothetical protein
MMRGVAVGIEPLSNSTTEPESSGAQALKKMLRKNIKRKGTKRGMEFLIQFQLTILEFYHKSGALWSNGGKALCDCATLTLHLSRNNR